MRVDWVHPSWRDLVIDELASDRQERHRFLSCCGVDGAALALSRAGGASGERVRPLLVSDADWDALGDGLFHYCADLDEREAILLLNVLADVDPDPESEALIGLVLARLDWGGKAVGVDALQAWMTLSQRLGERPDPPAVAMTWLELEPDAPPRTPPELERFADWLRLAELLDACDRELLSGLGFPERYGAILRAFTIDPPPDEPVLERELRIESLNRLAQLEPALFVPAIDASVSLAMQAVPPELSIEVLDESPSPPRSGFPVERVLRDLDS